MKITLGKGYSPPQGVKPGQKFDAVASLRIGEDGIELLSIDGVAVSGEAEVEEPDEDMPDQEDSMPVKDAGQDLGGKVNMPWG